MACSTQKQSTFQTTCMLSFTSFTSELVYCILDESLKWKKVKSLVSKKRCGRLDIFQGLFLKLQRLFFLLIRNKIKKLSAYF
jgi:hypothetical protein